MKKAQLSIYLDREIFASLEAYATRLWSCLPWTLISRKLVREFAIWQTQLIQYWRGTLGHDGITSNRPLLHWRRRSEG
jgi:hypothetical protein